MLRVYRDRETDRNIPFSVLLPHPGALQLRRLNALLSGILQQNSEPAALTYGVRRGRLDHISGGETPKLVGVKVRGMQRLFRHQKEK